MQKAIILLITIYLIVNAANAQANKQLTSQEMLHDLSVLQSAWTNLHPGLYRYNSPEQITGYFKKLRRLCSKSLPEKKFYVHLSQLAQKVKCGHTYLNSLNLDPITQERILPKRIIPFFFEIVDRRIIITHNVSEYAQIKRGDEITAINGVRSSKIIDSLLTVSRSDGKNALGKMLHNLHESPDEAENYSLFDIYFPLFFQHPTDIFTITVKPYSSVSTQTYAVKAVPRAERIENYRQRFGKIPVDEYSWDYKILNDSTAYMKYGTFAFWNSTFKPKDFVDSVFSDLLAKEKVTNLIIDIRNNEGGDNTGNYILSYITKTPIGCDDPDRPSYRYVSIPDTLKPHLSTWDNSFKEDKNASKYKRNELGLYELKQTKPCAFISPGKKTFNGKTVLLINAKNSSAGYEMARNYKSARLGEMVGETTGGSQQGINGGEFFFLTLPNSKFEIDLPLIYNYHANKPDSGIKPDHVIETTQRNISKNEDAQLDFALSLFQRKQGCVR